MAEISIPDAVAQVNLAALYDTNGHAHYVPAPTVAWYRSQGRRTVTVTLVIDTDAPGDEWLTMTEAAEQHVADVDGLTTQQAYYAVVNACRRGEVACKGERSRKRLDPVAFAAWRLKRREANLAQHDDG